MLRGLRTIVLTVSLLGLGTDVEAEESYGTKVAYKLGVGLANITTSWLEIPKCMVNGYNNAETVFGNGADFAYGVSTGIILGLVNTGGRIFTGALDVLTWPLPTKPIPQPALVWENFGVDTQYGKAFQFY